MKTNKLTLSCMLCLFSIGWFSQSQLIIYHPVKDSALAKKISILDLPELTPSRSNDSTLVFNYHVASPSYFMILLDKPSRWTERPWAKPDDTKAYHR